MIYTDSRYATGEITYANNARTGNNHITVFRTFPTKTYKFSIYVWTSADRIDILSAKLLGSSSLWWKLMDLNPEISNPHTIPVGTPLRVPNA